MKKNRAPVEQQYSPDEVAGLLSVDVSTVWRLVKKWRVSGGRDGLGPVRRLSHRITRLPASAVNDFLSKRTL